jgi:hypothetical protein
MILKMQAKLIGLAPIHTSSLCVSLIGKLIERLWQFKLSHLVNLMRISNWCYIFIK